MINSKELQKLSEKLENVDRALGYLNSDKGSFINVLGQGEPASIYANVSVDEKAVCDLAQQIVKALMTYRVNIERQIQGIVRP
jgi:hypothetical protein